MFPPSPGYRNVRWLPYGGLKYHALWEECGNNCVALQAGYVLGRVDLLLAQNTCIPLTYGYHCNPYLRLQLF